MDFLRSWSWRSPSSTPASPTAAAAAAASAASSSTAGASAAAPGSGGRALSSPASARTVELQPATAATADGRSLAPLLGELLEQARRLRAQVEQLMVYELAVRQPQALVEEIRHEISLLPPPPPPKARRPAVRHRPALHDGDADGSDDGDDGAGHTSDEDSELSASEDERRTLRVSPATASRRDRHRDRHQRNRTASHSAGSSRGSNRMHSKMRTTSRQSQSANRAADAADEANGGLTVAASPRRLRKGQRRPPVVMSTEPCDVGSCSLVGPSHDPGDLVVVPSAWARFQLLDTGMPDYDELLRELDAKRLAAAKRHANRLVSIATRVEDTRDERYEKRHFSLELNERKRRQWGSNSTRFDLEMQERARRLQQTDGDGGQPAASAPAAAPSVPFIRTLYPDWKQELSDRELEAMVISVGDKLPVMAFGHPVYKVSPAAFNLEACTKKRPASAAKAPDEEESSSNHDSQSRSAARPSTPTRSSLRERRAPERFD